MDWEYDFVCTDLEWEFLQVVYFIYIHICYAISGSN